MKCISAKSDVSFDTPPTKPMKVSKISNVSMDANAALIKNITYFKDYFDSQ